MLLPLIQLLTLTNDVSGFNNVPTSSSSKSKLPTSTSSIAGAFISTRSAACSSSSTSTTKLNAGLRDLVGPYDNSGAYNNDDSIRDERNSVFDRNAFGSGGFASGGNSNVNGGGGGQRQLRNSPGFVGFRGDDNYPDYDVAAMLDEDRSLRGRSSRGTGTRNIGNNYGGSDRGRGRSSGRFEDFDELPLGGGRGSGSGTRRIGDPYDRGLNSNFVNTNGRQQRRGPRGGIRGNDNRGDEIFYDDFDGDFVGGERFNPRGLLPGGFGRGGGGRNSNLPQVYQRDYLDTLDGRSFNQLTAVEQYFEAWNRRNIPLALSCFDDDVYYDDTQFSEPFEGRDKLADHLLYVADCLPDSFYFVVDELSVGMVSSRGGGRRRDSRGFQLGRSRVSSPSSSSNRARFNAPSISVGALWHVENEFGPLPFARGCSFFKIDPDTNLIVEAYDFPEPAVIKPGSTNLRLLSVASKLVREPERWFPFFAWLMYVYVVYFSNGILPGKDIFHADPKTWKEVQDLTFNFMFIAPAAHLPTAAKLNPVLEGIFNGLVAWSFMFAGFLSDERSGMGPYGKDSRYFERMVENQEQVLDNGIVLVPPVSTTKKNLISLVPTIIWSQFFFSAFFLPYLFTRTAERDSSDIQLIERGRRSQPRRIRPLYKEELDRPALVLGEWKGLGIILGSIGIFAIWWGFAGRAGTTPADFGPPIWVSDKRMVDFMKLLDKDRVAASFVVDMWVFGIFQGWLVDDDWKRRGRSLEEEKFLRNVAKFFPFFGLAAYLIFRPKYPSMKEQFDYDGFFSSERDRRRGDFERRRFGGQDRGRDRFDDRDRF